MCDPITIAGVAMTAAGGMMKMSAQQSAQRAELGAVNAERARQQGIQAQGQAQFDETRAGTTQPEYQRRLEESTAKRTAAYEGAVPGFDARRDYLPGQQNAPQVVQDVVNARVGDAIANMSFEAARRAKLNAWGDANLGNQLQLSRGEEGQNILSNFGRGSASILPVERQAAQSKAASPIGDLLMGVGQGVIGAGGASAGSIIPKEWMAWGRTPVWNMFGPSSTAAAGAAGSAAGGLAGTPLPFGGT